MADISVQFHALPDELVQFVSECVSEYALHLTAIRYRPFEAVEVDPQDIESVLTNLPDHRRFAFTIEKPCLAVANELDFQKANPDHLRLDIARQSADGLGESWLCSRTNNSAALRIWRQIAKRLKEMTNPGVTAINRTTGVAATYKSARYSNGAKALEESGVPMVPAQGPRGPLLKLGIVESENT